MARSFGLTDTAEDLVQDMYIKINDWKYDVLKDLYYTINIAQCIIYINSKNKLMDIY